MSFFNNFGKKIEDATKTAAKKSNELVEMTKINVEIKSEEDKIKKIYTDIGEKVCENYNVDDEIFDGFEELYNRVQDSKAKIHKLNDRALEIKNIKLCNTCSEKLSEDNLYCDKCGARQEVIKQNEDDGFITINPDNEE